MHTNLIILAGGASSRMKQSSNHTGLSKLELNQANSISKALIGVGKNGRPILDYILLNAEKAGYKNVYIVIGEQGEAFKEHYRIIEKNTFKKFQISFATQFIPKGRSKPLGTADALLQALEQFPHLQDETFTVCNSDNLYSATAFATLQNNGDANAFISYDRDGLLFTMDRISRFALVLLDAENFVVDIVEKPSEANIEKFRDARGKFRVSMNIFKLNGNDVYPFLRYCPIHVERDEKELPTAVLNMCKTLPKALRGIPFYEHVPDLTSKEDIAIIKKNIDTNF